ncbi:MAG: FAD/NAD(P)-binding protein [Fimbriimonas sp.]|nr:FAD/NAD(P)-binding protein [Fimbriimonas sp.]
MAHIAELPNVLNDSDPMIPRLMRVVKNRPETSNTFTLTLEDPDRIPFKFEPGQFNMVGIAGVGEVPVSVCGDPDSPMLVVHTIRAVGAITDALRRVVPGQFVMVRGPYGHGWPLREAEGHDVVIVCGGIGLAPMRPAVYRLLQARDRYGKCAMLYGTRTEKDILFKREFMRWRTRKDFRFELTLDRGRGVWRGNVGVVTDLISRLDVDAPNTIAMVCGYEMMMRFIVSSLIAQKLDPSRIFISMERNMKCGVGLCGHCQLRGTFVCRSGPVYRYSDIASLLPVREL